VKLTKKILNAARIHNGSNVCTEGGGRVFIYYTPQDQGRGGCGAFWCVCGVGALKTDPGGAWYTRGQKQFQVFPRHGQGYAAVKSAVLTEAMEWARKAYRIESWERSPLGDWQDSRVMERLRDKLLVRKR